MTDVPTALSRGGTWYWGESRTEWRFELGDTWCAPDVANVTLIPFVGDHVVIVKTSWGYSPVGGTLEPDEHWCNAATRELMEEAGAALPSIPRERTRLHPFGAFRCRSLDSGPSRAHLPWPDYRRVVAWAEVEVVGEPSQPPGGERIDAVLRVDVDTACRLLEVRSLANAAVYRLAAQLRHRGVDDDSWIRDSVHLLEEHYLREETVTGQSGKSGDLASWEAARRVVVDAIHRDGTLLDLGCANGLLMESVHRWAAEAGYAIEPHGLELSERLAGVAGRRLPQWQDRVYIGNALTWVPPRRFDFVHTMPDLVPPSRCREWLTRIREEFLDVGGRLIVRGPAGISDWLLGLGFEPSGSAIRRRVNAPDVEAAWLDARQV